MSSKTLNQLAADYADGIISKDTYRQARNDLFRAIIDGNVNVENNEYLAPLEPGNDLETTTPQNRDTNQIINISSAAPTGNISSEDIVAPVKQKNLPMLYIAFSCVFVILLIIAVVLFYPKPPVSNSQTNTANSVENNLNPGDSKAGEALIAEFLKANEWTRESFKFFNEKWNALSTNQKLATSQTKRMQRLSANIYKNFLEKKALISINPENAKKQLQELIEFAEALDIQDNRLQIPE